MGESLGEYKGLCIAEDTTLVEGVAAGGAVVVAALLVCLGFLGFRKVRTYFKLQRENRKRMRATVLKALATTRQLEYPVTVMRATDFCAAGTLLPHEQLRDQGLLTLFDSFEEARFVRCGRPIVFFSHQWTAFDTPDHTNKQYELMKRSLEQLCEVKEWMMEDVFVWVDFCSIPQTLSTLQSLAINSLAAYASVAGAFVVIAPQVQHRDLCVVCDEASYRLRMSCATVPRTCGSLRTTQGLYSWKLAGSRAPPSTRSAVNLLAVEKCTREWSGATGSRCSFRSWACTGRCTPPDAQLTDRTPPPSSSWTGSRLKGTELSFQRSLNS